MKISPARRIAFDVLLRVEREQAFASDLLHEALSESVSRADAALATELTMGVLRRQRELDFHIAPHSKAPLAKLDTQVLAAIRLGTYQLWHLDRVPAHAAINESVELVKIARKASAAPMVNAILRKMAGMRLQMQEQFSKSEGAGVAFHSGAPPFSSHADFVATALSHATWLVERWLAYWGEDRACQLMRANNEPPRLTCAIHDPAHRDVLIAELQAAGLRVEPGRWLRDALTISGGSVTHTGAWRAGRISIQDEASQMVARLLDVRPGDTVLDLCAAPGGKTLTLARAASDRGRVTAADFYWHRLHAMQQRLRVAAAGNVQIVTLNAAEPLPFTPAAKFNRILVDAPCTGTGTLARNPEIRWRLRPEHIPALHALQLAILRNALNVLGPGGRLVYSTCSLEPEENEHVIAAALRDFPGAKLISASESLAAHLAAPARAVEFFDSQNFFRTFPPTHSTDGFFAAAIQKQD